MVKKISKSASEKNFFGYLKSALEIIKLNRKTISEVSSDKNATKFAVVIVLAASFLAALINFFVYPDIYKTAASAMPFMPAYYSWTNIITSPIFALTSLFIFAAILNLVGKWFGGSSNYLGLFRVLGFSSILNIISGIPIINFLVSIWMIVIIVVSISEVQNLKTGESFLVFIIPSVILFILFAALMVLFSFIPLPGA